MCDTIVAPPRITREGGMLFAKNSDRQQNEAQVVEYFERADYEPGATLHCTYFSIPQVRHTHAVLLCRPFWMWGAEMGTNEHGVTIGNEALHARSPGPRDAGLTGMDLVRLALERANTAEHAVNVITDLLETYGQGGNCGHVMPLYYNNGFVIADGSEAFVLESIEREWLVERVQSARALSNRYSIERDVHAASAGLLSLIHSSGWSAEAAPNFADSLADPEREHIGNAAARRACSTSLLKARDGELTAADMMRVLRDHGFGHGYHPEWAVDCTFRRTLCMHAGTSGRYAQTVGSFVSELRGSESVHWVTGTAAPCLSIFKPVLLDVPLPLHGPRPGDRFDACTLWWGHEQLHRTAILRGYAQLLDRIRPERDALEAEFRAAVGAVLRDDSRVERSRVIAGCWQQAMQLEKRWLSYLEELPPAADSSILPIWEDMNRLAEMDLPGQLPVVVQTVDARES